MVNFPLLTYEDDETNLPGISSPPDSSTSTPSNKEQRIKRPAPTPPVTCSGQPRGNKKKLIELSGAVEELRAASEILSQPEVDASETAAFGIYVGKCLSKFPPLQSALAQQEIHEVITKYKLSLIESSGYASSTV